MDSVRTVRTVLGFLVFRGFRSDSVRTRWGSVKYSNCHAFHWMAKHLTASSLANPRFVICCLSGKIVLPPLHPVPPELLHLLTAQDDISKSFHDHIRTYNNALTMTSIGRKIDESVNNGEQAVNNGFGPYVFKLHGELCHKIGSLLPPEGEPPVYAQLYIYDLMLLISGWPMHGMHSSIITLWSPSKTCSTAAILQCRCTSRPTSSPGTCLQNSSAR